MELFHELFKISIRYLVVRSYLVLANDTFMFAAMPSTSTFIYTFIILEDSETVSFTSYIFDHLIIKPANFTGPFHFISELIFKLKSFKKFWLWHFSIFLTWNAYIFWTISYALILLFYTLSTLFIPLVINREKNYNAY